MFTVERLKSAAAGIVSTRANEPFFRGDEPERPPATPLSLRLGAPVSQRYRDVEDAQSKGRLPGQGSCRVTFRTFDPSLTRETLTGTR